MSRSMIHRATAEFATSGRTLEGLAYRFDHPSRVTDNGGRTFYVEAYSPRAAAKSLRERGTSPLLYFHSMLPGSPGWRSKWSGESFGPVVFRAGREGLHFETTLVETPGADDMLDMLDSGEIGDVSIGAYPIQTTKRPGIDAYRTEIALAELSLAPVGTGQHDGAKVLAVRANQIDNRARMRSFQMRMH